MNTLRRGSAGVSLIEALVALAVMAFGMLGVVGMQSSLRSSADASRQRSEAVRLAQEELERLRSFSVLPSTGGAFAFADIASAAPAAVALPGSANTAYTRATVVRDFTATDPTQREISVSVSWLDRRATSDADAQSITLSTIVAGIAPELVGSLGLRGNTTAAQRPRRRHPSIPPAAIDQSGTGTSAFSPPGSSAIWIFNNNTGMVTQVCSPTCTSASAWLLSGYIAFAAGPTQPTEADAKVPPNVMLAGPTWSVQVAVHSPPAAAASTVNCALDMAVAPIAYYCLVPVASSTALIWSGRSTVLSTGIDIASAPTDGTAGRYKVCRYTADPSTDTPAGGNQAHPAVYASVDGPLSNQNFLVIQAGDGTASFTCPVDAVTDPPSLINSNTRLHQP